MREIEAKTVTETIAHLLQDACYHLSEDAITALKVAGDREESSVARGVLCKLLENAETATRDEVPLCQDTGMAVVFLELGQEAHIVGGDFYEAVQEGTRRAYGDGYLRKSVVDRPFSVRTNTQDNTPAVIHTTIVPGDRLKISALSKGFGSENMSAVRMLSPSEGEEGIRSFVLETMDRAGANPCPPVVIGIGIGGTFEQVALLAKTALLRPLGSRSPLPHIARLEERLLTDVNRLGIGPAGYGGIVTALGLAIETAPTHIAGLPVALNMGCHATRHAHAVL